MLFNRSTYKKKASLFEQNEAHREAYLGIQHINDKENWYELCCALLEKDEREGKSLFKMAFSIMGELMTRSALLSAPSDELRLKLFLHLKGKEELTVKILYILNQSVKLQESVFGLLPPDSKERIITQLTDYQLNMYKEDANRGTLWLGLPTKEFIEKLDKDLQNCKSCGHKIEPRCKLLIKHSAYHLMCHGECLWLDKFLI
jgi:hypothetical protein